MVLRISDRWKQWSPNVAGIHSLGMASPDFHVASGGCAFSLPTAALFVWHKSMVLPLFYKLVGVVALVPFTDVSWLVVWSLSKNYLLLVNSVKDLLLGRLIWLVSWVYANVGCSYQIIVVRVVYGGGPVLFWRWMLVGIKEVDFGVWRRMKGLMEW